MHKITIYTDGSSLSNPGKGGYCAIIIDDATGKKKTITGGFALTTNNRMEIMGVLEAIKVLKSPCEILVYSDSEYVVDSINSWVDKWFRNTYKDKHKRKNLDLWAEYLKLRTPHKISAKHVRGHSGNYYNEQCDTLAKGAAFNGANDDLGYLEYIKAQSTPLLINDT